MVGIFFMPFFENTASPFPWDNEEVFSVTDIQRKKIEEMRSAGFGYSVIAVETGLSKDSVKAYCRSHALGGIKADSSSGDVSFGTCPICGKKFVQNPTRKEKKFCSDSCRMKWWNSHPELVQRKTLHFLICEHCGQSFSSKNPRQKYCSRPCYTSARTEAHNG